MIESQQISDSFSRIFRLDMGLQRSFGVLARLNPLAVIVAGLVVALAELGGDTAQISMAIPRLSQAFSKVYFYFSSGW